MPGIATIDQTELKRWLDEKRELLLLDVLPGDCFSGQHLPGARNACVYELTFLDQVRAFTADKTKPIVVYGTSANSRASSEAARKLVQVGYTNVRDFRGGLQEWLQSGLPTNKAREPQPPPPRLEDRAYIVDSRRSGIEWTGRNLAGNHTGTLQLSSGELIIQHGSIVGGQLVIDMKSIADNDISDTGLRQLLIQHLSSDDFFEVAKFPEARFVISETNPIVGCTPGAENCVIHGTLCLKSVERPLSFSAVIGVTAEGEFVAQAHLDFDRTLWNVLYGSGKFFEKLGRHLVNDLISIQLKIIAK
jgi:rhodanese-related sulfurtransferase/polyisoprenoid-binding protein YceI